MLDTFTARAGLRAGIRDGAAESHVVADELFAGGIRERVFHVSLLHLEMTVDVAAIVRLAAFRHLQMLPRLLVRVAAPLRHPTNLSRASRRPMRRALGVER